jgi:hypothetical protein
VTAPVDCPDWATLVAHRYAAPPLFGEAAAAAPPDDWDAAVAHLESCSRCRPAALAADPSLMFVTLEPPRVDDADVAAMCEAVRGMVRASNVQRREAAQRSSSRAETGAARRFVRALPAVRLSTGAWRGLAAAGLTAAALLVAPALVPTPPDAPAALASVGPRPVLAPTALDAVTLAAEPLVEQLDRPTATVYYAEQSDDMAVVMIIDPSLDV